MGRRFGEHPGSPATPGAAGGPCERLNGPKVYSRQWPIHRLPEASSGLLVAGSLFGPFHLPAARSPA